MFMIGWTGDAAAASLTIDLVLDLATYISKNCGIPLVPHILPLTSDPFRRPEWVTSDHLRTRARECTAEL